MIEQKIIYNPETFEEDLIQKIGHANYYALYKGQLIIQVRSLKRKVHTYREIAEILNKSKVPDSYQNRNKEWTDKRVGIVLRRYMNLMNLEKNEIFTEFPNITKLYKNFLLRYFLVE